MEKDIKILIAAHKPVQLPNCKQFYGIQVGQSFISEGLPENSNIYHTDADGDRENISDKNWFYCELTAQYFAYKNLRADYFGCMHYRRYLAFADIQPKRSYTGILTAKKISAKTLQKFNIDSVAMQTTIEQFDVILPKPFYYSMNLYQHFGMNHNIQALNIALKILYKKHPAMWRDAKAYLQQNHGYFCNMFIMKEAIFQDYSAWLFEILFEMEKELVARSSIPLQDDPKHARLGGYVAELLCGIYLNHLKNQKHLKTTKLPVVYFGKYPYKKKIAGILCPVHSKRRKVLDTCIQKQIGKRRFKGVK